MQKGGRKTFNKLEWCAFALKGEHNVYSLVPNIAVCMYIYIYILTKSEFISSCSRPSVSSNIVQITRATFFVFKKKRQPVAILDVQKSLSVAFLAISDQYEPFLFNFYNMAAGTHFGCPKFSFDRISADHIRSIRNIIFFWKFLFCEFV